MRKCSQQAQAKFKSLTNRFHIQFQARRPTFTPHDKSFKLRLHVPTSGIFDLFDGHFDVPLILPAKVSITIDTMSTIHGYGDSGVPRKLSVYYNDDMCSLTTVPRPLILRPDREYIRLRDVYGILLGLVLPFVLKNVHMCPVKVYLLHKHSIFPPILFILFWIR